MTRRPNGVSVSEAYEAWASCGRKVPYPDREAAELAAWATRLEESLAEPYECGRCGSWHLAHGHDDGLSPRQRKRLRYRTSRLARRPFPRQVHVHRPWYDPVLVAELGERALGCGKSESTGSAEKRRRVLESRARKSLASDERVA